MDEQTSISCPTCHTDCVEDSVYCHHCGEKFSLEDEYSLSRFLTEFFHRITHLDGKFIRSFKGIVRPGFLSEEYFAGRRQPYMRPLQFFLLGNVIFFLLVSFTKIDTFDYPLIAHIRYVPYASYASGLLEAKLGIDKEMPQNAYWEAIQSYAPVFEAYMHRLSKALIALILPFIALILWGFYFRKKSFFTQHLVVAAHFLTFVLLYQAIVVPLFLVGLSKIESDVMGIPQSAVTGQINYALGFFPVALAYIYLMFRRLYAQSILSYFLKTLAFLFLLTQIIFVYNFFLFHLTLWTT